MQYNNHKGFSLLEFLLVMALVGLLLAVLLPRFLRATNATRFAEVRHQATEIASFINQWTATQVQAQLADTSLTAKDFLQEEITLDENNFRSQPLLNHYTGNDNFNGVEMLISADDLPRNPFNQVSYFNVVNDFVDLRPQSLRQPESNPGPSPNPGLIYLTSFRQKSTRETLSRASSNRKTVPGKTAFSKKQIRSSERKFRFFYLIYTGISSAGQKKQNRGIWYGGMDDKFAPGIRKGVFVNRYPDIPYRPAARIQLENRYN